MNDLHRNILPNQYPLVEDDSLPAAAPEETPARQKGKTFTGVSLKALILLIVYTLGLSSGYFAWGRSLASPEEASVVVAPEASNPEPAPTTFVLTPAAPDPQPIIPASYTLPVSFGDIGPQLLAAGAIDYDRFVQVYEQAGNPLTENQLAALSSGSDEPIIFDRENAHFLLNFFWALGLTNQNILLTDGPMTQYGEGDIGRFASTGGWTIGSKPATELFAGAAIVSLTPEQQARLMEVAAAVYRPCCNNPTAFPDCNHGMAMLGMLELMAAQDATTDEMFEAAKYANAFWFPQQSFELALFFKNSKDLDFAQADAREFVSPYVASSGGFQAVHQWLGENGLLEQGPDKGNSCGV